MTQMLSSGAGRLIVTLAVVAAACTERSPTRIAEPQATPRFDLQAGTPDQEVGRDRKDTGWQRMTDAELAAEVDRVAGRVIIGLKDPALDAGVDNQGRVLVSATQSRAAREQLEGTGVVVDYEFENFPVVVATIEGTGAVSRLRSNPSVDYVEPSATGTLLSQATPWNIHKVQAPDVWSQTTGSGVKLLVIDSGIMQNHPDLSFSVAFRCISGPVFDDLGHGTQVIGVAAARDNSVHLVGVSPGVSLWSANVVNELGAPTTPEVACALNTARNNGVFVVNMSMSIPASTAVTDQINAAYYQNGMVLVAGVGRSDTTIVTYPASRPEVIAVQGTDVFNTRFGPTGSAVELSAPGWNIHTTTIPNLGCSTGGYTGFCNGTSYAAPHVAAGAALLKAKYPSWSNTTIRAKLSSSALNLGPSSEYGAGLLQMQAALLDATISGPTLVTTAGTKTWQAVPSGGTSYTYTWEYRPYQGTWYYVGSQQSYQTYVSQADNPYFDLRVTVASGGAQTVATKHVNVQIGGGCNPFC
jgi:subtilisin